MSKPEIKHSIKSESGHLLEAYIGYTNEKGFTGIIVYNNQEFYVDENKVYEGHHPDEDLVEENELWEDIWKHYSSLKKVTIDSLAYKTLEECEIYLSYFFGDYFYFSKQNHENVLNIDIHEILKGYIPTPEYLLKRIKGDSSLHKRLLKLERNCLLAKQSGDEEVVNAFSNLLKHYNFSSTLLEE